jgi:hypothetical protein
VPRALLEGLDADVTRAMHTALDTLAARGATLVDVELPHAKHAIAVYYLVATAEASSNLARYDGVRYGYRTAAHDDLRTMYGRTRAQGFGPEVKRRIMLGTYVLSAGYYDAYYLKAQQVRTLILRDYDRAFERADVVAMPTSPTPAFRLGERSADPLQMYLADIFTVSANLAGLPAISVACGFSADRLPLGLQLTGRQFDEATVLRIADAYQRDTNGRHRHRRSRRAETGVDDAWRRGAARGPHVRSRAGDSGHRARTADRPAQRRTRSARLSFRPHYWLSDDWFTPDGVPGIAIPFYLAHPRLAKLELAQMLEVEGGDAESCMRILRHEAGHAIDNAYRLQRRPTRRRLFGNPATEYPEYYTPKPYSKRFVLHLDHWYAQSHPDEDFAETFAVWLDPQSAWETRYAGWPAKRKIDYMNALMRELARRRPPVTSKRTVDPLPRLKKTLGEHYRKKREHYGLDHPDFYDSDLRKLFSDAPEFAKNQSAARFVRRIRRDVRAPWPALPTVINTRSISCSRRSSSGAASKTCG